MRMNRALGAVGANKKVLVMLLHIILNVFVQKSLALITGDIEININIIQSP